MKPSAGTRIPHDERMAVTLRDTICVGRVVGLSAGCSGGLELDHVRASGGIGMKSRSTRDNLVRLCGSCHRSKTENGRLWRPALLHYLEARTNG